MLQKRSRIPLLLIRALSHTSVMGKAVQAAPAMAFVTMTK